MSHAAGSPFFAVRHGTVEHLPLDELVQGEIELRSAARGRPNDSRETFARTDPFFLPLISLVLEFRFVLE